jgi:tetratricopeptide (TPR) repeat protein/predicted Ser/Thr protein kinase
MAHAPDERPQDAKPDEIETTEPLHGELNDALVGGPAEPAERPRGAEPDDEAEAREQLRGKLIAALFGGPTAPVELGRFVILARLGAGGMGVVYSAYDPELDRRVALKLLLSGSGDTTERAHIRLQREAQALARLTHPNVVPVYDVGVLDGRVFIVMELVHGQTLRQWASAKERSWREILDVYLQAGDGLAAAHAVGLVHRDFKPDNALLGKDGRVRVADFGLVRGDEGSPEKPDAELDEAWRYAGASASNELDVPLTSTGALVGTPAYMSPEQFTSAQVGPATDQFSFCVSLYEALYGERPFAGSNLDELTAAVRAGQVREPARSSSVPGWVHAVVLRGLAVDPRERFPSMAELVAALRRDPARARRRWLAVLAASAMTALMLLALLRPVPGVAEACRGAADELAGIWDVERRAAVEKVILGTGQPYARESWPLVAAGLDEYAAEWLSMHEEACVAHESARQSTALFDRRTACLERRRRALASALDVLAETDATSVHKAVEVIEKLPPIAFCANVEALLAEVLPPEDPEIARQVSALRDRLARAKALSDAGRFAQALEIATATVSQAENTGYRPVLAESLLLQGRASLEMWKREESIAPLHRAALVALSADMESLAVEAMARRIFSQATTRGRSDEVMAYFAVAQSLSERLAGGAFAQALLLNNAGTMYLASGERERAREYFERALAVRDSKAGDDDIELAHIAGNLAMLTPDGPRREELIAREHAELERRLGRHHLLTIRARYKHSVLIRDPARARVLAADACQAFEQYHLAQALFDLTWCWQYLAVLQADLRNHEEAAGILFRLDELLARETDADLITARQLARGYGNLYRGDHEAAIEAFQVAARSLREDDERHWRRTSLSYAHMGIGAGEYARGQVAAALRSLEQGVAMCEESTTLNEGTMVPRRLRWGQVLLASALWDAANSLRALAAAAQRARAVELIARAEAWYRSVGGYEHKLRELEAWRRKRGVSR